MKKITSHYRKVRMTFVKSALAIAALLFMGMPFINIIENDGKGYYLVTVNNEEIGAVGYPEDAYEAYLSARSRLNMEAGETVYMDTQLEVTEQDTLFGTRLNEEELAELIYQNISDTAVAVNEKAYTVTINDNKFTFRNKEDVITLLEQVKNRYDTSGKFYVDLHSDEDEISEGYVTDVVSSDVEVNQAARVLSSIDSEGAVVQTEDIYYQDGVLSVDFLENVDVQEIYAPDSKIDSIEEVYQTLTKENQEPEIYEVVQGDCLTFIAENHGLYMAELLALNPGLTWESQLSIGQEIIVTVPKPELSVVVKEEKTVTEEYNLDVVYVDNPDVYAGTNTVIQEASSGERQVVVLVETVNGTETSRTILKETVIREAVPQIIERGTKALPTYIKPISGGTLTSTFGARWGTTHYGVDWGCPIGTTVKASCGGTVITAGWQNGYGYTVVIGHSDGSTTRYAHLSKVNVYVGETVSQGEAIALSGNTGNSTGPHLHFEISINGTRVDPLEYLE